MPTERMTEERLAKIREVLRKLKGVGYYGMDAGMGHELLAELDVLSADNQALRRGDVCSLCLQAENPICSSSFHVKHQLCRWDNCGRPGTHECQAHLGLRFCDDHANTGCCEPLPEEEEDESEPLFRRANELAVEIIGHPTTQTEVDVRLSPVKLRDKILKAMEGVVDLAIAECDDFVAAADRYVEVVEGCVAETALPETSSDIFRARAEGAKELAERIKSLRPKGAET